MIGCVPTPSVVVAQVAVLAVSACVPQDVMSTPLSWKATVPVGVPVPGSTEATFAVKVTDVPNADGFVPEATVVVVEALATTCEIAADVVGS